MGIWGAGASEDYRVVTSATGEPVLTTMSAEEDLTAAPSFRPTDDGISAYELWQIQKKKKDIRQAYLNHWEDTVAATGTGRPVDAIIAPVAAYTAPPHGYNKYAAYCTRQDFTYLECRSADYTTVWNLLDYSALVIPVSKADETVDAKKPPHQFYGERDETNYKLCTS